VSIDIHNLSNSELTELIRTASARKQEIAQRAVEDLRDRIHKLIAAEGLTFEDVFGRKRDGRTRAAGGGKVAPKFRNPNDPKVLWSGRGIQPLWFRAALEKGMSKDDLRIR
jgi:DNA-binding protein H-NS